MKREHAAVLNAALRPLARRVTTEFAEAAGKTNCASFQKISMKQKQKKNIQGKLCVRSLRMMEL